MIRLPDTLSFRLTCWYAGTFAFFLVLALVLSYFALDAILVDQIDDDLAEDVAEFQQIYAAQGMDGVIHEIQRETADVNAQTVFLRVLDLPGYSVYSSSLESWKGLTINQDAVAAVGSRESASFLETVNLDSQEFPTRIVYGVLSEKHLIQIGESLEDISELLELILLIFSVMMFLVIPVASYIGWRIAQKAVRGITEVSRAAVDIRSGQFDRQIATQAYGEEISTLVSTFNAMAQRIQKLISEMREMTDNIAHDLRSPIARIRIISETVLAEHGNATRVKSAIEETITECDRLIRLINNTLDVAEAEADVVTDVAELVDLSAMAEDMCELYQPLAEQKKIKLCCDIQTGGMIRGRRQNLQRVFVNLIDNALKYTDENGETLISLTCTDELLTLEISDTGIGISEDDQPFVFDRFYRCDESRSQEGCGLGLSFVAAVVKAHAGNTELSSTLGQGTRIKIIFPI